MVYATEHETIRVGLEPAPGMINPAPLLHDVEGGQDRSDWKLAAASLVAQSHEVQSGDG